MVYSPTSPEQKTFSCMRPVRALLIRDRDKEFDYTISSILERSGERVSPGNLVRPGNDMGGRLVGREDICLQLQSNGSRRGDDPGDFNLTERSIAGNESPHGIWSDGSSHHVGGRQWGWEGLRL